MESPRSIGAVRCIAFGISYIVRTEHCVDLGQPYAAAKLGSPIDVVVGEGLLHIALIFHAPQLAVTRLCALRIGIFGQFDVSLSQSR